MKRNIYFFNNSRDIENISYSSNYGYFSDNFFENKERLTNSNFNVTPNIGKDTSAIQAESLSYYYKKNKNNEISSIEIDNHIDLGEKKPGKTSNKIIEEKSANEFIVQANTLNELIIRNEADLLRKCRVYFKDIKKIALQRCELENFNLLYDYPDIKTLVLLECNLGGKKLDIGRFKNLQVLALDKCFNGSLDLSGAEKSLQKVVLSSNRVDIKNTNDTGLINLSHIVLINNNLVDLRLSDSRNKLVFLKLDTFNDGIINQLHDFSNYKNLEKAIFKNLKINRHDSLTIEKCDNLKKIEFYESDFNSGTLELSLRSLEELEFADTQMQLTDLAIYGKNLKKLKMDNCGLENLEILANLHHCKTSLQSLDISNNRFKSIFDISEFHNINELVIDKLKDQDLDWNPLLFLKNLQTGQGYPRLYKSTFAKTINRPTQKLNEAKIMIVGDPNAGKTTLLNMLIDKNFNLEENNTNEDYEATLGIDIKDPVEADLDTDSSGSEDSRENINIQNYPPIPDDRREKLILNYWDFGGQDIQYFLHHIFLTNRSFYILVVDDRQGTSNLNYWFETIRIFGKGSPVTVVQNEKDINAKSFTKLNIQTYRNRYKDLFEIDFFDVDLKKRDKRFNKLKNHILNSVKNSENFDRPLPKGWEEVKHKLHKKRRENKRNYISLDGYKQTCSDARIEKEADQLYLLDRLNELGTVMYFKDNTTLSHYIYLRPNWLADAIYKILQDKNFQSKGRFTEKEIFHLWGNNYKKPEKERLFQVMCKKDLDICYAFYQNGKKYYLAPHIINNDAAEHAENWDKENSSCLKFSFSFIPNGLVSRIVVRLSSYILKDSKHNDLIWRDGALFQYKDDLDVLLLQDIDITHKDIWIYFKGSEVKRKEFFIIIKDKIDEIFNSSYKKIDYSVHLPCFCNLCQASGEREKHFYRLKDLYKYAHKGGLNVSCGESTKSVPIEDVLYHFVFNKDPDENPEVSKIEARDIKETRAAVIQTSDRVNKIKKQRKIDRQILTDYSKKFPSVDTELLLIEVIIRLRHIDAKDWTSLKKALTKINNEQPSIYKHIYEIVRRRMSHAKTKI